MVEPLPWVACYHWCMKRALAAVLITAGLLTPAWAGFKEGVAAYKCAEYATALKEWLPLAEQGFAKAQHNLGVLYYNGEGIPQDRVTQDYAEAVRWYRKAAEQGIAGSQFSLGFMYDNGLGVAQDHAEATRWFREASERGGPLILDIIVDDNTNIHGAGLNKPCPQLALSQ